MDRFIEKIYIEKVRYLEDFEIALSSESMKHLIITGKDGSGKTSLLYTESILNCRGLPVPENTRR